MLDISINLIGNLGAQYLASTLQKNQVILSLRNSIIHSLFKTGTDYNTP